MGVMHPELVMRNMIPVVMAGVLGIYGLIVAVILNGKMSATAYGLFDAFARVPLSPTIPMAIPAPRPERPQERPAAK